MGRMDGKVAIISGGARGMGAEEVNLVRQGRGAKVVFGDILDDLGQQVEADCRSEGLDVAYTHLDVTSEDDWQAIVALAEERYGKLDALVNNAGISISVEGGARNISLEDTSVEQWDRVMDINSKGVFLGTKAAIPAMRRAGGGSIINISSIAGLTGAWSRSHPYNASKGAVRLFTKATAVQHAREGIRANSVHPGPIMTPMSESTYARPGGGGAASGAGAPGPAGASHRGGLRRAVPGVGRSVLRNGRRTGHRRRVYCPVKYPSSFRPSRNPVLCATSAASIPAFAGMTVVINSTHICKGEDYA